MLVQPCGQALDVRGPTLGVADRVQQQLVVRDSQAGKQLVVELDHLGVDRRVGGADRLDGELPVLAVAAALRRRVPVHRRDRVELHGLALPVQAVLEVGARDRGGRLGPQRQRAAAAVLEGVHLLLHHIRAFAGGAGEERGVLEHRRLDRAVAVEGAQPLGLARDEPPEWLLGREEVVGAARRLEARHEARNGARKGLRSSSTPMVVGGPCPE